MPRSQLIVLIALVLVLAIGGVAVVALSRPQTQVSAVPTAATMQGEQSTASPETPANSSTSTLPVVQLSRTPTLTRTPIPTAQNTVIPSNSTFVPMPTQVLFQTSIGPTLTPSGPMIKSDNQNIQRLQENFPPQLGGFDFVVEKDPWAVGGLGASYQYGVDQRIGIGISIGDGDGASSQLAEAT